MGLRNILRPSDQIQNSVGQPLSGGQVFLYEPGTQTFISSFRDSGLVVPHTANQAVRLSGSGRANIWISRDCDMRIEDRNGNLVLEELNANPDTLGEDESGGLVPNGSFEEDANADMIPDGYDLLSEAGAVNSLDTSESTDGAQSFRFTSSGAGGGSLTTTDFFPVNDVDDLRVNVDLRSTLATVRNIVRVEWYDVSQISISNTDAYDSVANPTVFTEQQLVATPPANARFAKIRLIGIDPSVLLAGSTYFDRLSVFYPTIVPGIFDNITIQNNEIISTNLNGDVNLNPNGTGRTVVKNATLSATPSVRGLLDLDPATSGNQDALINLDNLSGLNAGAIGYAGGDDLDIRNFVHGGRIRMQTEDAGGVLRNILIGDGDDATILYSVGVESARTRSSGMRMVGTLNNDPAASGVQNCLLEFVNSSLVQAGAITWVSTTNMNIRNSVHGGQVVLEAEDISGVAQDILRGDPDGSLQLSHNGTIRGVTDALGIFSVRSDGDTDTEGRQIVFRHQNGTIRATVGHAAGDVFRVRSQIHGALVRLEGEDTGGTLRSGLAVDPDLNTQIFHPPSGIIAAQTQEGSANDNGSWLAVRHSDGNYFDVGLLEFPAVTRNAAYTFLKSDIGKNIRHDEVTARTWTINQSTDINPGSNWLLTNKGSGVVTLDTGAGVTLSYLSGGAWVDTTGSIAFGQGEVMLKKVGDTLYEAVGTGLP